MEYWFFFIWKNDLHSFVMIHMRECSWWWWHRTEGIGGNSRGKWAYSSHPRYVRPSTFPLAFYRESLILEITLNLSHWLISCDGKGKPLHTYLLPWKCHHKVIRHFEKPSTRVDYSLTLSLPFLLFHSIKFPHFNFNFITIHTRTHTHTHTHQPIARIFYRHQNNDIDLNMWLWIITRWRQTHTKIRRKTRANNVFWLISK